MLRHLMYKIKSTGPITVAEYMKEVLTNPAKVWVGVLQARSSRCTRCRCREGVNREKPEALLGQPGDA